MSTTIQTPIPPLLDDWKLRSNAGSDAQLRQAADKARAPRPSRRDPFTPLVTLNCAERLKLQPHPEKVVWEDDSLMALVDIGDEGSTLLLVPKKTVDFLIDLDSKELSNLGKVAAGTCDALFVAANRAILKGAGCRIYVNPLGGTGLDQLHVHVEAQTGVRSPVEDAYLMRAGAHLRSLFGGKGCF